MPKMRINIIIPTLNELNNIEKISSILINILDNSKFKNFYKVCVVDDDSKDGTDELLPKLKKKFQKKFDYIIRKNETGLSSAIIYGFENFKADFYIITDADIQYDLSVIIEMIDKITTNNNDIVIASRILGNVNPIWKKSLKFRISRMGFNLVQFIFKKKLPDDILSGFFMINNNFFLEVKDRLSKVGFKILLDLFLSSKKAVSYDEVYSEFKSREMGQSKMDFSVLCDFLFMILDKFLFINKKIIRFVVYLLINIPGLILFLISFQYFSELFYAKYALFVSFAFKFLFNINFSRVIEWSFNRVNYFNFFNKINFNYLLSLFITFFLIIIIEEKNINYLFVLILLTFNTSLNYVFNGKKWKIL